MIATIKAGGRCRASNRNRVLTGVGVRGRKADPPWRTVSARLGLTCAHPCSGPLPTPQGDLP